jgi:beta-N-acetylhexosaminidase
MPIGHLMLDLQGTELNQEEVEILQHPQLGGIILFTRNYESKKQLRHLTQMIRKYNQDCLIAVDQEGGRVQRFRNEFSLLPAFNTYGNFYARDVFAGLQQAEKMAYVMASELLDVGVNLSFTPVLDIDRGISIIIGDRSFSHDVDVVVNLGSSYIRGMHRAGMPAIGKHFPGHGAVVMDSHISLPIDSRDFQTIINSDLQSFIQLNHLLDAVMTAHVLYNEVDDKPASFSAFWLQKVLREKIGFSGVVFSDDLSMAGAEIIADCGDRARVALDAGCDMILICNHRENAITVLDKLGGYANPASKQRLSQLCNLEGSRA